MVSAGISRRNAAAGIDVGIAKWPRVVTTARAAAATGVLVGWSRWFGLCAGRDAGDLEKRVGHALLVGVSAMPAEDGRPFGMLKPISGVQDRSEHRLERCSVDRCEEPVDADHALWPFEEPQPTQGALALSGVFAVLAGETELLDGTYKVFGAGPDRGYRELADPSFPDCWH